MSTEVKDDRVTIEPLARGPLVVRGPIRLLGLDGQEIDVSDRRKVRLCRCGHSSTRPLCDGSHNRIPFEVPES